MGVNQELKALYNLYKNIKQKNGGGGGPTGVKFQGEKSTNNHLSVWLKEHLKLKRPNVDKIP